MAELLHRIHEQLMRPVGPYLVWYHFLATGLAWALIIGTWIAVS